MMGGARGIVRRILSAGPNGWGYDRLLLAGPAIILLIAVFGRNVATLALAAAYVTTFVIAFVYNGVR